MKNLGGTANIPQQFGIEFSMKLKPLEYLLLPFNTRKSLPLLFSNNGTTNFFLYKR